MKLICAAPLLLASLLLTDAKAGAAAGNQLLAAVPFEVISEHVVIGVKVGDTTGLRFVLDSGAGSISIDSATAERLGLDVKPFEAAAPATGDDTESGGVVVQQVAGVLGAGGAVMNVGQAESCDIEVGALKLAGRTATVMPLTHFMLPDGKPIDGIIGYDLLKDYIVEVNHDNQRISIFDRKDYVYDRGGEAQPLQYLLGNKAQACVEAEVELDDGEVLSGLFVIDSGAGLTLSFNAPFVKKHDLLERTGAGASKTMRGLSKGFATATGRITYLDLCGFPIEDLPVTLSKAGAGFTASDGYAGIIGNVILRRFNIVYDYSGDTIYLEPGSSYEEPF